MLGISVPVPSLSGRSASLRVLPERAAVWYLKHLIWRILLVIRRPVCGLEAIFLPALREGRSKPAGLVDQAAQRLIGEESPAQVVPVVRTPRQSRGYAAGRKISAFAGASIHIRNHSSNINSAHSRVW